MPGIRSRGERLKLSQFRAAEDARFEPVRGRPPHAFQVAAGFKITVKVLFAFSLSTGPTSSSTFM